MNARKTFFQMVVGLLLLSAVAKADSQVAKYYDIGHSEGEPLFVQETHTTVAKDGEVDQDSVIKDAKGEIQMTEKIHFSGIEVRNHEIQNLQTNEVDRLKVVGHELTYQIYDLKDGHETLKTTKTETVADGFVAGPVTVPYLASHWDELMAGKKLKTRFSIFEVEGTVGFSFRKTGTEKIKNTETVLIEMRPTNVIFDLLVEPILLAIDPTTKKILRYRGRTPIRKMKDGKGKPMDADIFYSYGESK